MSWYAIAFVIILIVVMIVAGYYLVRSYFRDYTYDVPSKT
jgi:uncharacterized protein YneF (UPF0154 family)